MAKWNWMKFGVVVSYTLATFNSGKKYDSKMMAGRNAGCKKKKKMIKK